MSDQLDGALELFEAGVNVLAAPLRQKSPAGPWKRYTTERITRQRVVDLFGHRPMNVFAVTGVVSRVLVLDCDTQAALEYWQGLLGEVLERTAAVKTSKGWHFWFRIPDDVQAVKSWKGDGFDVQADGKGVVAPPSVHQTGHVYAWAEGRRIDAALVAPAILLGGGRGESPAGEEKADEAPRSTLRHLLSHPPQEGGRNDWLSRVAGHYASRFREQDLYDYHVRWAARELSDPLPDEEVEKLIPSIWGAEQDKHLGLMSEEGAVVPEQDREWRVLTAELETGYLVSGGFRILTQCKVDEEGTLGLDQWCDADFRVLGVMTGESSAADSEEAERELTYDLEIRYHDGKIANARMKATDLASNNTLDRWFAMHDVHHIPPDKQVPRAGALRSAARLHSYLSAQNAPSFEVIDHLGWHEPSQAFITHEGVITDAGAGAYKRVKPSVRRDRANYSYGFAGREDSKRVLAEVLTFHDSTVTAVYGAWWAAVFLKPQFMAALSQFPFMAIQAPSESGKSTGFFSMMLQLAGARDGETQSTKAALRDFLGAHASGIVWIDDLDDPAHLMELIRGSTTGATITKKGIDHTAQVKAELRGALVISGEALGLEGQKALGDRAVTIQVPNPKGRVSLRDESRPQWDDILDLKSTHPDLSVFAGEYVRQALAWAPEGVRLLRELRPGTGRFADKMAVLRSGARLLALLSGDESVTERVDTWVGGEQDTGAENALTLSVLPYLLNIVGSVNKPNPPDPQRRVMCTPVLEREDGMWFCPAAAADWWRVTHPGGVSQRTETQSALTEQAVALGMGGKRDINRKRFRYADHTGQAMFWLVPDDIAARVRARSAAGDVVGGDDDDHLEGF